MSETTAYTQLGVQLPNGKIVWGTKTPIGGTYVPFSPGGMLLEHVDGTLNLDELQRVQYWYSELVTHTNQLAAGRDEPPMVAGDVAVVQRTITTTTSDVHPYEAAAVPA